ncbi:MAG: helix-turn-helix domain-containing protein [Gammaproteobacteria bacterium]|nr:helix-turn-helix domain-containing protein [Gammaproteobacteria bacterium]
MGTKSPELLAVSAAALTRLGQQIRARRKAFGISAAATAEAAGVSRVTLHRIEKGEPSVSIGAWFNVAAVLDLKPGGLLETKAADPKGWIPARIPLDRYPQLRALAWHVQGVDSLSPVEALAIYERNARHLEESQLSPAEQNLIEALREALGEPAPDV